MLNAPLYDLGDTLVLTGSDLTETSGNLTYYYSEDDSYNSVSERYVYNPLTSNSYYSENYYYSSNNGITVDNVYSGYRLESFDDAGRLIERQTSNTSNYIELSSEYQSTSSTTTSYVYSNTSGYELDSATEIITSSRNGVTQSINEATFDYSYLEAPTSMNDYYQRRTSGTADNNADSIVDYTYYNLETVTDTSYDLVSVVFDSSAQQTGSYSSSYVRDVFGSYETEESQARDDDGDGIINYSSQRSSAYLNDASGNYVSSNYENIVKQDFDDDGKADYVTINKGSSTTSSSRSTELIYDAVNSSLSVGIGINSLEFGFTLELNSAPPSWTNLGGHVADIPDTYLA